MRNQKDFHYLCINCWIKNSIFDKIENLKIHISWNCNCGFKKKAFWLHCCVRICIKLDLYQMETQEAFFRLKSKPLFSNKILKISYEITIVTFQKTFWLHCVRVILYQLETKEAFFRFKVASGRKVSNKITWHQLYCTVGPTVLGHCSGNVVTLLWKISAAHLWKFESSG